MSKEIVAPMPGLIIKILVEEGDFFDQGDDLVIMEAMKMENTIVASESGVVNKLETKLGAIVTKSEKILSYTPKKATGRQRSKPSNSTTSKNELSLNLLLKSRRDALQDENRKAAVEKRRAKGHNTARENIKLLSDEDSFKEYGGLVIAAQRYRRSEEDLIKNTPADGLVTGIASINKGLYNGIHQQCLVMAYDYMVLVGTQGAMNHTKMDRMLEIAKHRKLPIILFAEGGGGRPGDVDVQTVAGLFVSTFVEFARLSGVVPRISIVSGYCFAGNAALAGSSDIIIGTKDSSIGMGGPAMIEGGGLGKFHPKEVGPSEVHIENGVIDILVEDENEGINVAKKYLSYFQGPLDTWKKNDQKPLNTIVPENRKRVYDIRALIKIVADQDSVLEIKPHFGKGVVTTFIRIEGQPMGVVANDSSYEAGAITAENAVKMDGFMKLCNNFGLPLLSLVDTPGIMVGPDSEKHGTVKHASKLFITGGQLEVPFFCVILRRAYGLGAMAMMGGSTRTGDFTLSWPTGEFGAMGLEGAVQLGFRKELEAIKDPDARRAKYDAMVDEAYKKGSAISAASYYELDDVIYPSETRNWIAAGLRNHK